MSSSSLFLRGASILTTGRGPLKFYTFKLGVILSSDARVIFLSCLRGSEREVLLCASSMRSLYGAFVRLFGQTSTTIGGGIIEGCQWMFSDPFGWLRTWQFQQQKQQQDGYTHLDPCLQHSCTRYFTIMMGIFARLNAFQVYWDDKLTRKRRNDVFVHKRLRCLRATLGFLFSFTEFSWSQFLCCHI